MPRFALAGLALLVAATRAIAVPLLPPMGVPETLCRSAILASERAHAVPSGLMTAIGRVESGRRDPTTGTSNPWPWTVNAEGQGAFYDTKEQAVAAVRSLQARGVRSIDVGCMQVNLMHHPNAFASLELAFDPATNADYAGRFLTELHGQTNAWPEAVAHYHSATPELGADYQRRVMAIWPEERGTLVAALTPAAAAPMASLQRAWAATINSPPVRHVEGWHIIMRTAQPGQALPPGRSLDQYRAMPVFAAMRVPVRTGG